MRTTVDIEGPILKNLRAIQKREGGTLGALVSRLLAQAIAQRRRPPRRSPFAWTARPMRARVDLSDKGAVHAVLERSSADAQARAFLATSMEGPVRGVAADWPAKFFDEVVGGWKGKGLRRPRQVRLGRRAKRG